MSDCCNVYYYIVTTITVASQGHLWFSRMDWIKSHHWRTTIWTYQKVHGMECISYNQGFVWESLQWQHSKISCFFLFVATLFVHVFVLTYCICILYVRINVLRICCSFIVFSSIFALTVPKFLLLLLKVKDFLYIKTVHSCYYERKKVMGESAIRNMAE